MERAFESSSLSAFNITFGKFTRITFIKIRPTFGIAFGQAFETILQQAYTRNPMEKIDLGKSIRTNIDNTLLTDLDNMLNDKLWTNLDDRLDDNFRTSVQHSLCVSIWDSLWLNLGANMKEKPNEN